MSFYRADVEEFLGSPLASVSPWELEGRSPQREFLRAARRHRTRIIRAGNQCGKTFISVYDMILSLLGWHPFSRLRAPLHAWHSALDWEFGVGQILWPKYKIMMPWNRVRSVHWMRKTKDLEIPASIVLDNGSRLDFKSAEAGRGKYQGAPLAKITLDEEHPGDVGEECKARLLANKEGGELVMALTPVKRERWILDAEKAPGTHVTRMSSLDAARAGILNEASVRSFGDSLPDRQRAVRLEGDFAALEGLVYPSFHRTSHVLRPRGDALYLPSGEPARIPWPIPAEWPRFAAMDFGYTNPAAVVVAALDPHRDAIIVYRVFYCASVRASRWGQILNGRFRAPSGAELRALPQLSCAMICDHDAGERAELENAGISTAAAIKDDLAGGIETTERWLEPRRLYDGRPRVELVLQDDAPPRHPDTGRIDAAALAEELESYRYPEAPRAVAGRVIADPKDVPIKKNDHACDALRYLVVWLDKARGGAGQPLVAAAGGEARSRLIVPADSPNDEFMRRLLGGNA